jgi:HSP20 family protein
MNLMPWRNKRQDNDGELTSLSELRTEMDRLFDNFMRDPWDSMNVPFRHHHEWAPALDVAEDDHEVTVRAELPGVDPKELEITVLENVLTLSGEKKEHSEKKEKDFFHSESRYGSFRRSIALPSSVDVENVTAEHSNGVVTIKLQKSQTVAPKRIPILSVERTSRR